MKLITMTLLCLLVAGMWLQDANSKSLLVPTSRCCYEFVKKLIHPRTVQCYREASNSCSHKKGVIFKMKRGKERCVSTEELWVKYHLPKLTKCNQTMN